MAKYELTNETKIVEGRTLYRIKALRKILTYHNITIEKGDLRGFIEFEDNLSQKGTCWVGDDACVYEQSKVIDFSLVKDNAQVYHGAFICDKALIKDKAIISGSASIAGNSIVTDNAKFSGTVLVLGSSVICGSEIFLGDGIVGTNES